jgi:hypothetical protein
MTFPEVPTKAESIILLTHSLLHQLWAKEVAEMNISPIALGWLIFAKFHLVTS